MSKRFEQTLHENIWKGNKPLKRCVATNELEKAMAPHSSTLPENPMDGGAWWAAVYGIAESDTTEVT